MPLPRPTTQKSLCVQVDLKTVLADKAYILFYTRRPVPLPLAASVSHVRLSTIPRPGPKAAPTTGNSNASWTGEGSECTKSESGVQGIFPVLREMYTSIGPKLCRGTGVQRGIETTLVWLETPPRT